MIRAIIFDCFGVLYSGSLEHLVRLSPAEKRRDVLDINSQKDYGFITYQDYVEQVGEIIQHTPEQVDEIIRKQHVRNVELVEFARRLRETYMIGMLSNVGEQMMEGLFPSTEQAELFDEVLLSYKEGLAKPNPAIFTLMAERMGLSPGECVMIDDLESNCDGAEIAGMQSIQHITNSRTRELLLAMLEADRA